MAKYAPFLNCHLLSFQVKDALPKVEVASNTKKAAQGPKDAGPAEMSSTSQKTSDSVCHRQVLMPLTIFYLDYLKFLPNLVS